MLRRIVSPFRTFGLAAGALYAFDRVLRRISPGLALFVYEFMVQPVSEKPLLRADLVRTLEFREIESSDPEIGHMPTRPAIKRSRFEQGAVCLGAFRKDSLIGYIWFSFGEYDEDEVRCTYQLTDPGASVFDFDLFVFPEYRMGIGFMGVWHGANQYLRDRGVHSTYSRLTRFNLASRRSHYRLGGKRIGRAIFLRACKFETMLATIPPFVSVTLRPPHRVRLKLHSEILKPINKMERQT